MNKIEVEVLCEHPNNANTYFIYNGSDAIIVDPANDIRSIKTFLKNKNLKAVLLTHGHYDHFKTLSKVLKEYDVKCYMHKKALSKLKNVDTSCARMFGCNTEEQIEENQVHFVSDGTVVDIDGMIVKCIYKPGHTDCSMVYIIDNIMFSGDFLFNEGIGRFDLPTSSGIMMRNSLHEIVQFGKKQDYIVYPGHGDITTLFYELKNNPYLLGV